MANIGESNNERKKNQNQIKNQEAEKNQCIHAQFKHWVVW